MESKDRKLITPETKSVSNGWATISIDPTYPPLVPFIQRAQTEPREKLIAIITEALGVVLKPGIEIRKAKDEEFKQQGKDFHPVDLGSRHDPPVPLYEAFVYTSCGSIGVLAAYLASQAGLEAGIICGKVLVDDPGRGGGGHTVCAIQPFEGYPKGLLFEAADGISSPFRPKVAELKEGEYLRIKEDASSFILQLTGCKFELYGFKPISKKLGEPQKPIPNTQGTKDASLPDLP